MRNLRRGTIEFVLVLMLASASVMAVESSGRQSDSARTAHACFVKAMMSTAEADCSKDAVSFLKPVMYANFATLLAPDNAGYWFLLGYLSARIDDNIVWGMIAEDALKRSLKIQPSLDEAAVVLGQVYFRRGSYNQTLEYWEKVLLTSPTNIVPGLVSPMCHAYLADFQVDRGVRYFSLLMGKSKTGVDTISVAVAALEMENGRNAEAEELLQKIVKDPGAMDINREYAGLLIEELNARKNGHRNEPSRLIKWIKEDRQKSAGTIVDGDAAQKQLTALAGRVGSENLRKDVLLSSMAILTDLDNSIRSRGDILLKRAKLMGYEAETTKEGLRFRSRDTGQILTRSQVCDMVTADLRVAILQLVRVQLGTGLSPDSVLEALGGEK